MTRAGVKGDFAVGSMVLIADLNWRKGPVWPAMLALMFGRREHFVHLGMRCTLAWWKGTPYLVRFREVTQ